MEQKEKIKKKEVKIKSVNNNENILPKLTKKQKAFLQYLIDSYNEKGHIPSTIDIIKNTQMSQSNVYRNVKELLKKGYLEGTTKSLKILYDTDGKAFKPSQEYIRLPLLRLSIYGENIIEDHFILDRKIIMQNTEITVFDKVFLIKSSDDSLKNIGILENTLLIVLQTDTKDLKNNEIVSIKYENKFMCRIYKKNENAFYSLSPLYATIPFNEKVEVLGKVIASINMIKSLSEFT
ncbi:S24 family peptidase [Thermoanaerobacter thermohydrosulfuricus]